LQRVLKHVSEFVGKVTTNVLNYQDKWRKSLVQMCYLYLF